MSTTERLARALENLNALVWGECPALLNEDSGGNSALAMEIEEVLAEHRTHARPERCPCGYPMPCVKTVPVEFCKA